MRTDVIQTIKQALGAETESVTESTRFDYVAHDSMAVLDVIVALSDKYNLVIDLEDLNEIHTLGDMADYVIKRRGNAASDSQPET